MAPKVLHALVFSIAILLFSFSTTSSSYQYQTLVLDPLPSSSQILSQPEREVISQSESTTSLSLHLTHIDDIYSSSEASRGDLLDLRLQRDSLRVKSLTNLATGTVVSGVSLGSGEYFVRLGVGTPAKDVYMILDTGSDTIWLQCLPCQSCYNQSDPIFNPAKSKSYAPVPCGSPVCQKLGTRCVNKTCVYAELYGDKSFTTGDFSTETLTFRGASVDHIALGCGHNNTGSFGRSAGLLGLGRGEFSFPSQTKKQYNGKFSYCFPDRFSSGDSSKSRSSIVFGDDAIPKNAIFTPIVTNPNPVMDSFYYMRLLGISVGGSRVRNVTETQFKIDPVTGDGGVIIDSGTTVTYLKQSVYVAFRDAFRRIMSSTKFKRVVYKSLFDTCYDFSGMQHIKVPTVEFHFAGADVLLPRNNYLMSMKDNGTYCFAFATSGFGNLSIFGNIQQQGFRIAFDSVESRIGFLPDAC